MNIPGFGERLRAWRQRRRMSQQALAELAGLSARHLSFLETGRASPSRETVLRLAERLDVPLRERNPMLEAAGFAPMFRSRSLDAPEMQAARRSLQIVLDSLMPNPSLAFDRCYRLVAANPAVGLLLEGVDPALLAPPVNVVRVSLHPLGLAPRIVNYAQWRGHILDRLRRQAEASGDPALTALLAEAEGWMAPEGAGREEVAHEHPGVLLPLKLRAPSGVMSFVSTVTVFGTPHDITLQELAIESFLPADEFTAQELARLAG